MIPFLSVKLFEITPFFAGTFFSFFLLKNTAWSCCNPVCKKMFLWNKLQTYVAQFLKIFEIPQIFIISEEPCLVWTFTTKGDNHDFLSFVITLVWIAKLLSLPRHKKEKYWQSQQQHILDTTILHCF